MKVFQFIILAAIVALFLGLAGCEEPKGHLELKEPKKELSEMPERKDWLTTPVTQQPGEATEE